jgi:hypothetical protein
MTKLQDEYQLSPLKVPEILLPVTMKYFVKYRRSDTAARTHRPHLRHVPVGIPFPRIE